ncbi:MAG: hypothetical protein K2X47_11185 [Bdellovibrionales bacterium]|nr:hypothetical protein [Bdellovibrionales bacterium]
MIDFFLTVFLFFMVIAGLGSLLFASSRLPFVIWNFFWYWVMGNVAIRVFGDPHAGWLGIGFAIVYLIRSRRPVGPAFVFKTGGWKGPAGFPAGGSGETQPGGESRNRRPAGGSSADVIEAEVIDAQTTEKD